MGQAQAGLLVGSDSEVQRDVSYEPPSDQSSIQDSEDDGEQMLQQKI